MSHPPTHPPGAADDPALPDAAARALARLDESERQRKAWREGGARDLDRLRNDPEVQKAFEEYRREYGDGDPTWWKPEFVLGEAQASERAEQAQQIFSAAPVKRLRRSLANVILKCSPEERARLGAAMGLTVDDLDALASSDDQVRTSQVSLQIAHSLREELTAIAEAHAQKRSRRQVEAAADPSAAVSYTPPLRRPNAYAIVVGAVVVALALVLWIAVRPSSGLDTAASGATPATPSSPPPPEQSAKREAPSPLTVPPASSPALPAAPSAGEPPVAAKPSPAPSSPPNVPATPAPSVPAPAPKPAPPPARSIPDGYPPPEEDG
jgi:hypothetical protein